MGYCHSLLQGIQVPRLLDGFGLTPPYFNYLPLWPWQDKQHTIMENVLRWVSFLPIGLLAYFSIVYLSSYLVGIFAEDAVSRAEIYSLIWMSASTIGLLIALKIAPSGQSIILKTLLSAYVLFSILTYIFIIEHTWEGFSFQAWMDVSHLFGFYVSYRMLNDKY